MENIATKNSEIVFPSTALVGSIGDLAKLLANGSEVCEEFFFASGLNCTLE